MRCLACQKNLSDREATRKYASTLEFIDLCDRCLKDLPIATTEDSSQSDVSYNDPEEETNDGILSEI